MMLLTINIVIGMDMCEDTVIISSNCTMVTPEIECTTLDYKIYNVTGKELVYENLTLWNDSVYYFNFTLGQGDYLVKLCDGTTREVEVGGDDEMASLAITFFILIVTGFFAIIPFIKKEFVKEEELADYFVNMVIRRGCFAIAIFLMTLNTAIIANISKVSGLGAEKELLDVYMILLGYGGYVALLILVVGTFIQMISMAVDNKKRKRLGE